MHQPRDPASQHFTPENQADGMNGPGQTPRGISVVIPNYNGEGLLPQILPTVITALQALTCETEILVADDCSTDGSISLLQREFPMVRISKSMENGGFSRTANRGIRAASHPWVLLLNSDVKLEPNYFKSLMKYTTRPKTFGVMGRIVGWDDDRLQDAAKYPYRQGLKIKTSGNYLLPEAGMRDGIYSMYLSGANALLNRSLFLEIGGFNELFSPFYVEDYELSLRAWRLGLVCWYDDAAVCRHRTSSTISSSQKRKQVKIIYNRNKMFLHSIHLAQPARSLWFLQAMAEALLNLLLGKAGYVKSMGDLIRNYAGVRKSRRALHITAIERNVKLMTVGQVITKIKRSIDRQQVTRF